jgi:hypothetical protein
MLTGLSSFVVKLLPLLVLVFAAETASAGCGTFCRGKPLDSCELFWVLESGFLARIGESDIAETDSRGSLFFELGRMRNITSNSAVGGSIYGSALQGDLFGIKGRYRRWLGRKTSLDISPGILLGGSFEDADFSFPGFVGSVTIHYADWAGVTLQFQTLKYQMQDELVQVTNNGTETDLYIGARLGSYAGLAYAAIAAIGLALARNIDLDSSDK